MMQVILRKPIELCEYPKHIYWLEPITIKIFGDIGQALVINQGMFIIK